MPIQEIREIQKSFKDQLLPAKIYLFGAYASNNHTHDMAVTDLGVAKHLENTYLGGKQHEKKRESYDAGGSNDSGPLHHRICRNLEIR